jgi:hypothetical protein
MGNAVKDFHSGKRAFSQIPYLSTLRLKVGIRPMPGKSQRKIRKTLQFFCLRALEKILHGVALWGFRGKPIWVRSDPRPALRPGL